MISQKADIQSTFSHLHKVVKVKLSFDYLISFFGIKVQPDDDVDFKADRM